MKHLKLFETTSEYDVFKSSSDFVLPNVSCTDDGKLYYNPFVDEPNEPASSYVAVDLGLPSGRLWADRNVGATSPEDGGLFFQWGSTVGYTKEHAINPFNWYNYFDTIDNGKTFNKYSIDKLITLETSDDAASVIMGSDWRMPTRAEAQELIDNTTVTFINIQGKEYTLQEINKYPCPISLNQFKCFKLTGSNGNSIFFYGGKGNSMFDIYCNELYSTTHPYKMTGYCDPEDGGRIYLSNGFPRHYYYNIRGVK